MPAEHPSSSFAAPAPPPVDQLDDFADQRGASFPPPVGRPAGPESPSDQSDSLFAEQRNLFEPPAAAPPVLRPADVDPGDDDAWSDAPPVAEPLPESEVDSFAPPRHDGFNPPPYPEQRQDPYAMSDATLADDFGGYRKADLTGEPEQTKPKKRFRYEIVGGVVLVGLIVALIVVLLGREPEELPTSNNPVEVPSADPNEVHLVLAPPDDRKKEIELTWRSSRELDFAVSVAPEGQKTETLLAERSHSMVIRVDPDLKYCFQVQATDGNKTWKSKPVGVRGAQCST